MAVVYIGGSLHRHDWREDIRNRLIGVDYFLSFGKPDGDKKRERQECRVHYYCIPNPSMRACAEAMLSATTIGVKTILHIFPKHLERSEKEDIGYVMKCFEDLSARTIFGESFDRASSTIKGMI